MRKLIDLIIQLASVRDIGLEKLGPEDWSTRGFG
jgi:hypothetical protein